MDHVHQDEEEDRVKMNHLSKELDRLIVNDECVQDLPLACGIDYISGVANGDTDVKGGYYELSPSVASRLTPEQTMTERSPMRVNIVSVEHYNDEALQYNLDR